MCKLTRRQNCINTPVSYTHLDVYKRQVLVTIIRIHDSACTIGYVEVLVTIIRIHDSVCTIIRNQDIQMCRLSRQMEWRPPTCDWRFSLWLEINNTTTITVPCLIVITFGLLLKILIVKHNQLLILIIIRAWLA